MWSVTVCLRSYRDEESKVCTLRFFPSILALSFSLLSSFLFLLGGEMVQVKLELVHPFFVLMIKWPQEALKSFKQEIKRSVHFDKCWEGQEQSGDIS